MTESNKNLCKYVFVIIKIHSNNTLQTNYQRCCHANISNITMRYAGSTYHLLAQYANWNKNKYSRFYKEFMNISKNLGNNSPGL